ncbi:MAG: hypothetical protein WCD66_04535 [Rhodanobacteraceae bacterium]
MLGEAILVVSGILIALQINNWNEQRIEQTQVRKYARALIGDLQATQDMLVPTVEQVGCLPDSNCQLGGYTRGKRL